MSVSIYYATVEIGLTSPLVVEGAASPLWRFYRSYYVRATSEEQALAEIRLNAAQEASEVLSVEISIRERIPWFVRLRAIPARGTGVIWRSGRAFFPEEDVQ